MSWNASFAKPVEKCRVPTALEEITMPAVDPAAYDQFQAAREVALLLSRSLPGPYLMVSLSGHANGVGWQKKAGMSNDCINVSISQICPEDLQYYKPTEVKEK